MDPIVQIFISDHGGEPPELLRPAIHSVQQCFSAYRYTRYSGESLRSFIEQHFDREVLAAYDKLKPYAYKADLGRYCLLYEQGGWYADISILMRQAVGPMAANVDLVYFFDLGDGVVPGRSLFDVSNSLIYAKPRLALMARAIEQVVRHCRDEFCGSLIAQGPGWSCWSAASRVRSCAAAERVMAASSQPGGKASAPAADGHQRRRPISRFSCRSVMSERS